MIARYILHIRKSNAKEIGGNGFCASISLAIFPYLSIFSRMLIKTPEEMIQLGREVAEKWATHVLLYGELWAGKTHFVKGFVEGKWLDPYDVQSPTYTYFHDYDGQILHVDMYRLEDEQSLVQKGILQQLQDYDMVLIERPRFTHLYADDYTIVKIEKTSPTERDVTIE